MNVTKPYEIEMEVAGQFACFADPQNGSETGSYPAPTYSAAKGMFESILRLRHAEVVPVSVNICRPIQYTDASFNSRTSPLRKPKFFQENGGTLQIGKYSLTDVVYQIFANVRNYDENYSNKSQPFKKINHAHSYQCQFNRRLKRGRSFSHVFLGSSDLLASYVGPIRKDESDNPINNPIQEINMVLATMLFHPADSNQFGEISKTTARFLQNVQIQQGVLRYAKLPA